MRFIMVTGIVLTCAAANILAQTSIFERPTDAEVRDYAARLDPKNDKKIRLDALKWLNSRSHNKNLEPAMPALELCIRKDPDMKCRSEAVCSLAFIAYRLERPCPLAIVEAYLDKEDEPRWMANAHLGLFKSFAPGAVEVFLRCTDSEKWNLRSDALLMLARAGPKDKRALTAIEKGKQDKTFEVRQTAHLAWFNATDRLDQYLEFMIRVREDPDDVLSQLEKDSEAWKHERITRNLVILGSALHALDWSEKRADELATALVKLLEDKSAVMRRGAANLIGAVVVKVDFPDPKESMPWVPRHQHLLPYVENVADYVPLKDNEQMKDKPPQASRAAGELEKRKVQARLTALRDKDPDRMVREAAGRALERLASVRQRKQK